MQCPYKKFSTDRNLDEKICIGHERAFIRKWKARFSDGMRYYKFFNEKLSCSIPNTFY